MVWPGAQFYSSAHLWGKKLQLQQPDQTSSCQTASGTVFSSIKQEGCSGFPCKGLTKPQHSRAVTHSSSRAGGEWDLAGQPDCRAAANEPTWYSPKNGHSPTHGRGIVTHQLQMLPGFYLTSHCITRICKISPRAALLEHITAKAAPYLTVTLLIWILKPAIGYPIYSLIWLWISHLCRVKLHSYWC